MAVVRLILPKWHPDFESPKKAIEGDLSEEQVKEYNSQSYNCYEFRNYPSHYKGGHVSGPDIDVFKYVFLDLDMKDYKNPDPEKRHDYATKEEFIQKVLEFPLQPTEVIDSGGGVHGYWEVTDLDAMSYLKLQRRLAAHFKSDKQVSKIAQLMRIPGTVNTKNPDNFVLCELLFTSDNKYTCEDLDKHLPKITQKDLEYCERHYQNTYHPEDITAKISDEIPLKFANLIRTNAEAKQLWIGEVGDRSKADYRLGHIMMGHGLSKDESLSVLVNSRKALERAPTHRFNYASDIVEKIYAFEKPEIALSLSSNVKSILQRSLATPKGQRFPCHPLVDATEAGFRLGQVLGLVGGSGSGKTTFALNVFKWFTERNPDYVHFFVSLEQPEHEIAERWATMCGDNTALHESVQILGNYNEDDTYRNLSLSEIKDYIVSFQKTTGKKVGCVCLDHVGVLKKKTQDNEFQGLSEICQQLKSFASETKSFFIVQSQTSREKAGIGDLELDKDAAFGTSIFEHFVDYLVTIWQPLKRVYSERPDMTCVCFKFCKIRKKNVKLDRIKEDVRYVLMYETSTELLRERTQVEIQAFDSCNRKATALRKQDRKTDVLEYNSTEWAQKEIPSTTSPKAS